MAVFVLDASVAISWCFTNDPSEDTPYSRRVLRELAANYAIVPEVWAFEIANSISISYKRRKRINERQVREYLELLYTLPISTVSRGIWDNVDLHAFASAHSIAAYDAAYLALAQRTGFPLATSDADLRDCAMRLGIPLFS